MKIKTNKCCLSSKHNLKYKKKIRRTFKRKNTTRSNQLFIAENRINYPYKKRNINKLKLQSDIKFLDDIKYINGILNKLEKCKNKSELISIDHRELKNIDNSAILYLTAGLKLLSKNKMIRKPKLAPSESINNRLAEIGYWEALCRNPPRHNKNCDFLKIKELNNVDNVEQNENDFHREIINFFFKEHNIDNKYKEWLFDAIYEAFTNVVEHAFIGEYKKEDKNAWLLGSYNRNTNELEFIFYDVGIGLFQSWALGKTRTAQFFNRVSRRFGIDNAFKNICKEKKSRHKNDKKRGNGLIAFKKFIDEISEKYPNSYLEIATENKLYLTKNDMIRTLRNKVRGTFIRWVVEIKD